MTDRVRKYQDRDFYPLRQLEQGEKGAPYSAAVFIRQCSILFPDTLLVMESGPEIAGYTLGAFIQGDVSDAWVLRLKVAEPFHNRGYGKALLTSLTDTLRIKGAHRVWLSVASENTAALNLYRKEGFLIMSYKTAYFGESENRYIFRKNLVPERNKDSNSIDPERSSCKE